MTETCFASRTLLTEKDASSVKLTICQPEEVGSGDWKCTLRCEGGSTWSRDFFGIDAIQALTNALDGAALISREKLGGYQWTGSGGEPDAGFRRIVPMYFGSELARRVESLIDHIFEVNGEVVGKLRNDAKIK